MALGVYDDAHLGPIVAAMENDIAVALSSGGPVWSYTPAPDGGLDRTEDEFLPMWAARFRVMPSLASTWDQVASAFSTSQAMKRANPYSAQLNKSMDVAINKGILLPALDGPAAPGRGAQALPAPTGTCSCSAAVDAKRSGYVIAAVAGVACLGLGYYFGAKK